MVINERDDESYISEKRDDETIYDDYEEEEDDAEEHDDARNEEEGDNDDNIAAPAVVEMDGEGGVIEANRDDGELARRRRAIELHNRLCSVAHRDDMVSSMETFLSDCLINEKIEIDLNRLGTGFSFVSFHIQYISTYIHTCISCTYTH